ncbi:hypothetical protein NE237_025669 [Protea cynaroides]|uniref:Uncharacterized protein n=1 Tax=Protea cynaroides TaxID=273540 RepID=A0A9Q0H2S4_9MAGN|nr:hypothetical protein NE237_025669 [Protea cynaroides]
MTGYSSMKMKRKDLEEVYDEFSEFSLSSPARKIRRLDAELPPIMEEEETPEISLGFDQPHSIDLGISSAQQVEAVVTEALPYARLNEERALVLYKPMNKPLVEITVNSDLIPGWRNHVLWPGQTKEARKVEDEATDTRKNTFIKNDQLAVVPWVPSQLPLNTGTETPTVEVSEQMETEGVDSTMMEIEDDNELTGGQSRESWQQWQQQHCMSPGLPRDTSTPIMWSW